MTIEDAFAVCRGLYPGRGCACEARGQLPCLMIEGLLMQADGNIQRAIRNETRAVSSGAKTGRLRHVGWPEVSPIAAFNARAAKKAGSA